MLKYFPFLLLAVCLNACFLKPPISIDDFQINFTCPEGWEITEIKKYANGNYISVEKDGYTSSGLLSFTWYDYNPEFENLDELSDIFVDNFKSNIILKNSKLKFTKRKDGEYNGIPCREVSYTMSIFKIPHEGQIITFHHKGKTVVVNKQGAVEDQKDNNKGFGIIEDSFRVKEGF